MAGRRAESLPVSASTMTSQTQALAKEDNWRERLDTILSRTYVAPPPAKEKVEIVQPLAEPGVPALDDAAEAGPDEWQAGWWAMAERASLGEGRDKLAMMRTAQAVDGRKQPVHEMTAGEKSIAESLVARGDADSRASAAKKAGYRKVYGFFQNRYGSDNLWLPAWQMLCRDVEVEVGSSVEECEAILKLVYVYLYPFVIAVQTGGKIEKYASFAPLRKLVLREPFPLGEAYENRFLKVMLRKTSRHNGIFEGEERRGHAASQAVARREGGRQVPPTIDMSVSRRSRGPPVSNDMSAIDARIAAIRARKASVRKAAVGSGGNGQTEATEVTNMLGRARLED